MHQLGVEHGRARRAANGVMAKRRIFELKNWARPHAAQLFVYNRFGQLQHDFR